MPYDVGLEITGPIAMWTQPNTGDAACGRLKQ
jgi:hypothetical protein